MNERPQVVTWYYVYVGLMAAMYLLVGLVFLIAAFVVPPGEINPEDRITLYVMPVCVLPFAILYLAAFFLPRSSGAWVFHLVLIAIGMTSACCLPVCIPLLIFWLKPEAKAWYGRE